ncbi:MAG: fibronectin type III domain-containing protein [Bacteroidota bacterium]
MKKLFILLLIPVFGSSQTNLMDSSSWTEGTGSAAPPFIPYGTWNLNGREMDIGPHGTSTLIWKAFANNTNGNEGGWDSDYLPIDSNKTYRLTVWIKRTGTLDGDSNFGFKALDANDNEATLRLDGTVRNNPYFVWNPPPTLNDWYLLVAFVYGHGHIGGTNDLEGVYNTSGIRVESGYDSFKFASTAVKIRHRAYLRLAEPPTSQWFYNPTLYEVNGQEPTIQELIDGPNAGDIQSPTAPTLLSSNTSQTTVDLSWSGATDNVGVTGYKVFKDGILETTLGNVNTYEGTGLTASTSYNFTVRALDAAGNESPSSNSVSVTTDSSGASGGSGSTVWTETGSTASYTGDVAIGASSVPAGYKLAVDGYIRTREIRVDQDTWPDYVFAKGYNLPSLEDIQKHIEEKGHLPNMPSAKKVQANGMDVGEMNRLLLEKIEEMTLYILQQQKEIDQLKIRLKQ